jgi:hypothetical protein
MKPNYDALNRMKNVEKKMFQRNNLIFIELIFGELNVFTLE